MPLFLMIVSVTLAMGPPASSQARLPAGHANIAGAATIVAEPPLDAQSVAPLVDGRLKGGLAYEVGSSGHGQVTFTWDQPREVSGVRLRQTSEIYVMNAVVAEGNREGAGAFDLRLGEATDTPINEWIELTWETATVAALRVRCTEGESGGRRAHPCWGEIEVIGVPLDSDIEAAAKRGLPVSQIPKAPPIRNEIALRAAGTMPVILAPGSRAYDDTAAKLAVGLGERLGNTPEIVHSIEAAGPGTRTVICLGSMLDNPLLTRLYFNRYTYVDAAFPGDGGYVLQTVLEPYPWARGQDVIVIGCSDGAGAAEGVAALLERIEDGDADASLPYTVEVQPSGLLTEEQRERLDSEEPKPSFTDFRQHAELYLTSGEEAYAQRAIAALDVMVGIYEENPDRSIPWPEETTSGAIFAAWDAFDECPLIDPEGRTAYVNAFLRLWRSLIPRTSGYGGLGRDDSVTWNHTTFPLLGLYFGGRYFERSFGLGEAQEALSKARACFTAQARSWKPQEDADSYLELTIDHAITYSLAEWDLSFFESGLMKRYGDYVAAVCDSGGLPSGFGDSGFSSNPTLFRNALPLAFWWTKDPGYLWLLNMAAGGAWENPFWRDVKPEPPERLTGVTVFPLDAQLYQYTQTKPYYNEALRPADVPPEEAFDKVSFRESWDRDAQYLLLDGFARGKHLHYDGNSITEFVEDGERWLIDHDYLVRNTTEHNMLSVLRDGRGDVLEPSMAGLRRAADLPGVGFTETYVKDYNGVDWTRRILWRKGKYFIVADDVQARETGEYDLELTWKTIDLGSEPVVDGRDFVATRSGAGISRDAITVDDPNAASGRAVVFGRAPSRLAFRVGLPAGEYAVRIVAYGVDGSSDSLWMSADGGEKVAFHVPQGKYGSSSTRFDLTETTPHMTLDRGGAHVFTIWLRELPPVRIDRIIFQPAAGEPITIAAADAEPPTASDMRRAEWKALHIRPAEPAMSRTTAHERKGIAVPVRLLHQRRHAELARGDDSRFASLLCVTNRDRPEPYDLRRIADGCYAVSGPEDAICAFGGLELDGINVEAEACLLTASALSAIGCERLEVAGISLSYREPVDLSIDLKTGQGELRRSEGGEQSDTGESLGIEEYKPDRNWPGRLKRLVRSAQTGPVAEGETGQADEPRWRVELASRGQVRKVGVDDVDGDGVDELLVAHDQSVSCIDAGGEVRWRFDTDGPTRDVSTAQLADGLRVVVSSADTYLYILDANGELIRKRQMTGIYFSQDYGERPWGVWCSRGVDLNGDGADEIVSALANFELVALDRDLEELWGYFTVAHGCTDIKIRDIDGDDEPEIIVADKYGHVHALRRDGTRMFAPYSSIGDVQFDVGPPADDGRLTVVFGSSTGDLLCTDGKQPLWRFDNFGYPVNRVVCRDLTGDGAPECLIGSGTGYLYALDAQGQLIWRDRLGFSVNDVLVDESGDAPQIIYADEDGLVRIAEADGKPLKTIRTGAPARWLAQVADRLCVVTGAGEVLAYELQTGPEQ